MREYLDLIIAALVLLAISFYMAYDPVPKVCADYQLMGATQSKCLTIGSGR